MTSRARRGATDGSCLDAVPDAPDGLDQLVLLIAELLAKIPDVDLDIVGVAEEVVAPYLVENAVPGKDLVGMHHEQAQQVELSSRELDRAPVSAHLARRFIHGEVLHLEQGPGARIAAPHYGPDPRQQLTEVEWLGQVIVGTDLEALDSVSELAPGRQDDHAGVLVTADRFRDGQAIELGHHHVQHDDMRLELADHA